MNLKVKLMPTQRTDVLCIGCGNFGATQVVVRTADASETDVGIHPKCADEVAVRRVGAGG